MNHYPRSLEVPGTGSFLLCGARGTGKSSWLSARFPDANYIDFHSSRSRWEFLAQPARLFEQIETTPPDATVVIDEVPPLPDLLLIVDPLLERPPAPRIVVSISNLRQMHRWERRIGRAGAVRRELLPLTAWELSEDFDLDRALTFGTLPGAVAADDPGAFLVAYMEQLLHDEVEPSIRDPIAFRRFLQALPRYNNDVLIVSDLAREAGVHRKVAEHYLALLTDLFLVTRIPSFRRNPEPAVVKHSKFLVVDAGLLKTMVPPDRLSTRRRAERSALPGLVALHLHACLATRLRAYRLYFWRTVAGTDIDFVVDGPHGHCAIAIVQTPRLRQWDFSSLLTFSRHDRDSRLLLLYPGPRYLRVLGIPCVPFTDFFTAPWKYLPS